MVKGKNRKIVRTVNVTESEWIYAANDCAKIGISMSQLVDELIRAHNAILRKKEKES